MSKIIMSPVPASAVGSPPSGKCVFFFDSNNNNQLSIKLPNGEVSSSLSMIADNLSTSAIRTYSIDKIKLEIQGAINSLVNGAGEAYNTLKELADEIQATEGDVGDIILAMTKKVSFVSDQTSYISGGEQQTARNNIDVYGRSEIGNITEANFVELFESEL
jgi:hypothetical protein